MQSVIKNHKKWQIKWFVLKQRILRLKKIANENKQGMDVKYLGNDKVESLCVILLGSFDFDLLKCL